VITAKAANKLAQVSLIAQERIRKADAFCEEIGKKISETACSGHVALSIEVPAELTNHVMDTLTESGFKIVSVSPLVEHAFEGMEIESMSFRPTHILAISWEES
jgi:hypothetical protein